MKEGSVQIFMTDPPDSSEEALSEWNDACGVTEYLLYALENPKWIAQWHIEQRGLWQDALEKSKSKERDRVRSQLTLIKGGKSDGEE